MARTHNNFRTWAALILLGVLIPLFFSLGNWQLDRAAQRDAIHARIQHAARLAPVTLTPYTPATELTSWRHAWAQGRWLHRYTVLLQNRNYQSRPGYWVATPLELGNPPSDATDLESSGDASSPSSRSIPGTAVLVLRGWLARDDIILHNESGATSINPRLGHELATPDGPRTIAGELFPHVPRLFELWSWSDTGNDRLPDRLTDTRDQLPTLQNLDLEDYAQSTGLTLLPVVLAADDSAPPMVQDWPHPSSDADTNRGYALQWFSFGAIAAGAWLLIAWRAARKRFNRR